jgi:hypothetical protein
MKGIPEFGFGIADVKSFKKRPSVASFTNVRITTRRPAERPPYLLTAEKLWRVKRREVEGKAQARGQTLTFRGAACQGGDP